MKNKEEYLKCTRCNEVKNTYEFWYNNKRKQFDRPCKDCRNKQKRLRRKEMFINNKFYESELKSHYKLKNLPNDLKNVIIANLILDREIRKKQSIQITCNNECILIYCPMCVNHEVLKIPILFDDLIKLSKLYKIAHERCKEK